MAGKQRVAVLGASGMLGSMVTDYLSRNPSFSVVATTRSAAESAKVGKLIPNIEVKEFAITDEAGTIEALEVLGNPEWIVNCIGIIKPYIHDDNPQETVRALTVNSLFPHWLATAAGKWGGKVLQIATDCVYSGVKGRYVEADKPDAIDVYGKTKSLGEAYLPNISHLRCSIIGPETHSFVSLLEWFKGQKKGATLSGYTNHNWNGVCTLHYAKLCEGIIKSGSTLTHLQHAIPSGEISKCDLLKTMAECYNRGDLVINAVEAPTKIDRTLRTSNEAANLTLWKSAGYSTPPSVPEMVREMSQYPFRLGRREQ